MRLEGKRAIITAGASGMGKAGAELFVREGARLAIVDINAAALDAVVKACAERGADVIGIEADLSKPEEGRRIVKAAAERFGGVDVLWNHAGISCPVDIENLDMAAYDASLAVNVTSALLAAGEAGRIMREQGTGGSIVFTASTAGLVGSNWSPIYSAQKFAVVGLVKSLAQRFAPDNVRVNAVCPGPTNTPMLPTFFAKPGETLSPEELNLRVKTSTKAAIPLGRPGEPEEIAHAALWLASDDASFVTGIALPVDGGFTCR
jgi:NAD(P)-dependent dehydrogenase (short-subunit alcohol dehydrogenase family)